ncbi:MAG: Type 1 glutamine amidotransferase-like domain-containing protein [Deltaproteobacteria bacterium]|nr:Type 1 glutamine amidotransferase-like domain-containing protein [Deltaproteobacteria bacterium]
MRGKFLFNGNIGSPALLAARARPWLKAPGGGPPKVLLVTAAWGQGEYGEQGIRDALNAAGIPSAWSDGYDANIYNLCVWHVWRDYLARHPRVAAVDAEIRSVQEATRRFYVEKTSFHAQRIRQAARFARDKLGDFHIGRLPLVQADSVQAVAAMSGRDALHRALVRELVHDLSDLVQNDARMMAALAEEEAVVAARTGLRVDADWQAQQRVLTDRILRADVVLLLGGDPDALLNSLRFFDLGPALLETLRRGALIVSVSAGALVLCERMIIYDNYSADAARREFRLYDRGLGLVGGLQILPHCMDRIHTDDPDNLAYLARRFSSHLCVGLNEESFLLVDPAIPRAYSVGEHDGVFVFGADGVKWRYDRGEVVQLRR